MKEEKRLKEKQKSLIQNEYLKDGGQIKTFGDYAKAFWQNYIAPTKSQIDKKAEDAASFDTSVDGTIPKEGYARLSPAKRTELAESCPLVMKGVRKKSLDTVRPWFKIEKEFGKGKPAQVDLLAIRGFDKRANFKLKLHLADVAAYVHGDGYLLIEYSNDATKSLAEPPSETADPANIRLLNSEEINDRKKENDVLYYVQRKKNTANEILIHPNRILHVPKNRLPHVPFGLSIFDLLRYIIFSKKNIDIAVGEILAWFSHGLIDVTWQGMTKQEKKEIKKLVEQHPSAYFHDDKMEMKFINPTAIDPKPFYDYLILNIAGALVMPTHVLTGIQTGRVTGSEIGFSDYRRDVNDIQDLEMSPVVEKLYKQILRARGREWKYKLIWNPIYIEEEGEANILIKRVQAAEQALNGRGMGSKGFITEEEARRVFNEGQIPLEIEEKILPKVISPIPKENREMIEKWKKKRKEELDKQEQALNV